MHSVQINRIKINGSKQITKHFPSNNTRIHINNCVRCLPSVGLGLGTNYG